MDSPHSASRDSGVRLAELMAALSIATDLGMGQPMEYAMTSCIVAMRLGDAAGLSEEQLRDVYYEALLRYIGCNADTYWLSSIVGDEIALRTEYANIDTADIERIIGLVTRYIRRANAGTGEAKIQQAIASGLSQLPLVSTSFFPGHCEVAERLAARLGFPQSFVRTVGHLYARWDGKGVPALAGDDISVALLVASLANDVVTFFRLGGETAAIAMARERSGGAHSPNLVELFCCNASQILIGLDEEPVWEQVLALEPGGQRTFSASDFDNACKVMADFADIKSPYFLNHSSRVADIAGVAAKHCGLPDGDVTQVRRAGLLHDIGKVGISAGIWGKAGSLTDREWEQVRLHPYYAERVLARSPNLVAVATLASLHHERLDGSGYYRSLPGDLLSPAARVLAAANHYCALTERRAHRPAATPDVAAEELGREVKAGRLDGEAVNGVLLAAGHRPPSSGKEMVAGLSEREVEVLRLLARGQTMKQVASELTIAYKTVDRHVQNIYTKIGVSTRAGATLFAMENRLLD
jgi:HD-GYP domain-containing protein (c-di-GMP phosphodiesterase class II)